MVEIGFATLSRLVQGRHPKAVALEMALSTRWLKTVAMGSRPSIAVPASLAAALGAPGQPVADAAWRAGITCAYSVDCKQRMPHMSCGKEVASAAIGVSGAFGNCPPKHQPGAAPGSI
jgi:hypothetical protein